MTDPAPSEPPAALAAGLAAALRARVDTLHRTAERSGIVAAILTGRASREDYARLLRNLLPAYQAMEAGLERHRHRPALGPLAVPGLYRGGAIARDLDALAGPGWPDMPVLEAAARYARAVEAAAEADGARLIAHAYTRYMGDLSGGQVMRRRLARAMDLPPGALSLYDFPGLGDIDVFKTGYRAAIDAAGHRVADPAAVIEEAALAFRMNIDVSLAVAASAGMTAAAC
jgi:heme oxygenase